MAVLSHGMQPLRDIAKALGLEGQPLQKIVLEFTVDDAVRVYVKGLVETASIPAIVTVCEQLSVNDAGEVKHATKRETAFWQKVLDEMRTAKPVDAVGKEDVCHVVVQG